MAGLVPPLLNADPLETTLPDYGRPGTVDHVVDPDLLEENDIDPDGLGQVAKPARTDAEVLALLSDAERISRSYQRYFFSAWEYAELAYRSQHSGGSKYRKDHYRNRAKYFKPKTRESVRKALAGTRAALFASQDVITFSAEDDGNPNQQANAALLKEIINARLRNKTMKTGIRWKQIALGARLDCQKLGICASKQDWSYKATTRIEYETVTQPQMSGGDPMMGGQPQPVLDFFTRQPVMETVTVEREIVDVEIDKPTITLLPGENILVLPSADWTDPAQTSATLIVPWPMRHDDVLEMMKPNDKSRIQWKDVAEGAFRGALYSDSELVGLKMAREGDKAATTADKSGGAQSFKGFSSEIIDVRECFYRADGIDYHCWTLGDKTLLSEPIPTKEAYPAHRGLRPYVIGTDALETHVLYPESHVHSWRQSQEEINDFANIRMDANRQAVFPVAKVRRGRQIDYRSVQTRPAQGVIQVKDPDDVTFDRPPGADPGAWQEANHLANDLDALAGNFSQNSVQTNRQLNETVGGMAMIQASASASSELDLDIFVETWAEAVMSQIVMLEQFYEDDQTLLAVSGQKAKLFEKFGVDEITDEMLETQITVNLDITIGGADPMMRLMKDKTVWDATLPIIMLAKQDGAVKKVHYDRILGPMYSAGGRRNGVDGIIEFNAPDEPPTMPPEAAQALQQENEQMKGVIQQLQQQLKAGMEKTQMQEQGETERTMMEEQAETQRQASEHRHDEHMFQIEQISQAMLAAMQPPPGSGAFA